MQYMFTGVVFGNEMTAINYLDDAGIICLNIENKADWEYEFIYDEDDYNISLNIPSLNQQDYEDTIQMADFFIYFLNPNSLQDFEIFHEIHTIISKIKPQFRGFIIFRDNDGFINANSIDILRKIWQSYPYEPVISNITTFNQFQNYIYLLTQSVRTNKILYYPNTSWIQIPFLKKEILTNFTKQNWDQTTFLLDKLTHILKEQNNQEWQIWAEITAKLYAQQNQYLKGASIVEDFNPIFTQSNKKKYCQDLIDNGDKLSNLEKYTDAAQKYEFAARYAQFELEDEEMQMVGFRKAISAWICSSELQNVMKIIDQLEHNQKLQTLDNITDEIITKTEILEKKGKLDFAKAQLYLCFQRYQRMGLFDSLKVLAYKTVVILKKIIISQIQAKKINEAQLSLDELENIWESYEITKSNIDNLTYDLALLYLENADFQKVELLLPKLESAKLQIDLSNLKTKKEENLKSARKEGKLADEKESVEIITKYVNYEIEHFDVKLKEVFIESKTLIDEQKFEYASLKLQEKHVWFNNYNKLKLSAKIFMKLLDVQLLMENPLDFLENFNLLKENYQKEYIVENHQFIYKSFKNYENKISAKDFINSLNILIREYRNHLLYEEAKMYAELQIKYLFRLSRDYAKMQDQGQIKNAIQLIVQIKQIIENNFDEYSIDFDEIHDVIVQFYIHENDLQSARKFNQKIENLDIANRNNERIESIDHAQSHSVVQKAVNKQNAMIDSEKLSQLINESRDQNLNTENMYKMRNGLKRRYFDPILAQISKQDFFEAADSYFDVAFSLANTKKYQLAGLSASLGGILYIVMKKRDKLQIKLEELQTSLSHSISYFNGTFPIKLLNYMLNMIDIDNKANFMKSLHLFKNMPLFPEEQTVLETIIGNPIDFKSILQKEVITDEKGTKILPNNVDILLQEIILNPNVLTKRKALEERYWLECKNHFTHQNYNAASIAYIGNIKDILDRNMPEIAISSIVISFLCSIQSKDIPSIYQEYEKFIFKMEKINVHITKSSTLILLEYLLQYWDDAHAKEMNLKILKGFYDNLPLFDWESSYFMRLINTMTSSMSSSEGSKGLENGNITDSNSQDTLLIQQADVLLTSISENANLFISIIEKRSKMVRTYYSDIFQELSDGKYTSARNKYIKLAKRMARRNDFIPSSLMILLSVLVQNHAGVSLKEIKTELDSVMNSMGIIKNILYDQIGIKVSYFLIDAFSYEDSNIQRKIAEILNSLPFLEEEKIFFNSKN